MRQPDFSALWADSFSDTPRRVDYRIRFGTPNSPHDLQFVSSLVHDAVFEPSRVLLRRNRLTIPVVRDCWELGGFSDDNYVHHVAPAVLSAGPVIDLRWIFQGLGGVAPGNELMICSLCFSEEFWTESDTFDLVVLGDSDRWTLRVTLKYEDCSIRLRDKGTPIPASQFFAQ